MRTAIVVAVLATLLTGCAANGTAPPVDVDAAPDAPAPSPGAELVEAGWPELAAAIRAVNRDGKPAVVNLFASWCEPCKDEAPLLARTAEENPEIAFFGVDHRDLRERGEAFLEEYPLGFTTLWDFDGEVAEAIRARGMPTTAFFDTEGRMVTLHTGILDEARLVRELAEIRP
ncbi:MAG: TlpA disulfide reductase family protein [Nitriliruptorales bacterium]|nr:TlpA disulfide reductase family protein [Nitriliruptorales bacterium]